MHLCNNRVFLLASSLFVGLVLGPVSLRAQATAAPQSAQAPAVPPEIRPGVAETQPSLDVDRDPIISPDAADDITVSPKTASSSTELHKNAQGVYTLGINVDEVILNCTVIDQNGHLVQDLSQSDFRVYEDNTPQQIVSFKHQDLPVSLGLLIDNSGSMRDKRPAVNAAALDLVRASNPGDEAFVVNFSDEAYLDQDFTSSIDKLRQGLSHIDSRGGTALYDAVVASADQLSRDAKRPKQVLIIITDGEDNASTLNLEQTIRRIQDLQGPVVYSIGLLFGDDSRGQEGHRARRALQLLSDETGGLAFFPRSLSEVDDIAAEVARDIRNQYTVGYHSSRPASEGGYRTIHVDAKAPHHGKLIVRTRTGYYPRVQTTPPTKNSVAQTRNAPTH